MCYNNSTLIILYYFVMKDYSSIPQLLATYYMQSSVLGLKFIYS